MKNWIKTTLGLSFAAALLAGLSIYFMKRDKTSLVLINNTSDTVTVWLTLGNVGDSSYVQSVDKIFGIEQKGSQGYFFLLPKDTLKYKSDIAFNGNLCFGSAPVNCADTSVWPNGLNLFEFNLNNVELGGQETIDISCVAGVNCLLAANLGMAWTDGVRNIKSIHNDSLYKNEGLSGVYPYGCDKCTEIVNPPSCNGAKKFSKPQLKPICNIQRSLTGGKVYLIFNGFVD